MSPNSYQALGIPLPEPRQEGGLTQKGRLNSAWEPVGVQSGNARTAAIQAIIQAAEAGNTRDLFAYYRDEILTGSHLQAEFGKRKMPVLSEPHSLQAVDKENADDVRAKEACDWMIDNCENWLDGMTFSLDSTLYPVSALEKIFAPAPKNSLGLRWMLKRFEPVKYQLLCLRPCNETLVGPFLDGDGLVHASQDTIWGRELRFWGVDESGALSWDEEQAYFPGRIRHMVHRAHTLTGVEDRFGGPMRAIMFWDLLTKLFRDWMGRGMERYNAPFPVAKVDTDNAELVAMVRNAMSLSLKIGGMVVPEDAQVELIEAARGDMAGAYEKCLNVCNREISKVALGQTLSGEAQSTGLGSGTADLQGDVRDDQKRYDRRKIAQTVRQQVLAVFLHVNGLTGAVPLYVIGGLDAAAAKGEADTLVSLSQAGLEPTDEALPTISEKVGYTVQRKAVAPAPAFGGVPFSVRTFSATATGHPSDEVAARKAAALARAFRGSLAPVRQIILNSQTAEEAQRGVALFFADWKPDQVNAVVEEALQICAAAGSAEGVTKPSKLP